jgi:hypothetical protein
MAMQWMTMAQSAERCLPCSSPAQLWPNQLTQEALSHRVMWLEHKANCSPVDSPDIENAWCLLPLPLMSDVSSPESPPSITMCLPHQF